MVDLILKLQTYIILN